MSDPYIDRLKAERDDLEARIKDLQAQIRAINNLIYKKKSETYARTTNQDRTGKNAERLLFETVILEELRASRGGLRTSEIFRALHRRGFSINYNTLRSYIIKMRDGGLISKKTPRSYHWVVATEG